MTLEIVDLFCGAGGTSTGILKAVQERLKRKARLTAVNHWPTAINTHSLNHPDVHHLCENVENIHPRTVVRSGRLHLLAASCECTFHSNARGGGPCNEQSRSSYHGGDNAQRTHSVDAPLPTQDINRFAIVEPFITHLTHHGPDDPRCHSVDNPLPTVTGAHRGEMALVEPILVQTDQTGGNGLYARPIDRPLPTVVSKQNLLLVEPMIVKYYGTCENCLSVEEPLATVTTRDRFMLVECKSGRTVAELDIRTRMLQPNELAAAHSFPKAYRFLGNKGDQTKQIGNSVPVELAAAHAEAALSVPK